MTVKTDPTASNVADAPNWWPGSEPRNVTLLAESAGNSMSAAVRATLEGMMFEVFIVVVVLWDCGGTCGFFRTAE